MSLTPEGAHESTAPLAGLPKPPVIIPESGHGEPQLSNESEPRPTERAVNKIEVLRNRLVPGTDGALEHVVVANDQVTIIRNSQLKGRIRVTKDEVFIGGVNCSILLAGLESRVDTVRHIVGGEAYVYGAIFLTRQSKTPVEKFGSTLIGSPRAVVEALIEGHCAVPPSPTLKALAVELDGIFLTRDELGKFAE